MILLALFFATFAPAHADWNEPVEPVKITDHLYYVGTNEMTSFLITTPAGHIVLDGGFVETAPIILANIRKLGFRRTSGSIPASTARWSIGWSARSRRAPRH